MKWRSVFIGPGQHLRDQHWRKLEPEPAARFNHQLVMSVQCLLWQLCFADKFTFNMRQGYKECSSPPFKILTGSSAEALLVLEWPVTCCLPKEVMFFYLWLLVGRLVCQQDYTRTAEQISTKRKKIQLTCDLDLNKGTFFLTFFSIVRFSFDIFINFSVNNIWICYQLVGTN